VGEGEEELGKVSAGQSKVEACGEGGGLGASHRPEVRALDAPLSAPSPWRGWLRRPRGGLSPTGRAD